MNAAVYAATKLAVRTIFEGSRKESNKVRGI
jgi:NADP-dependent 3-hydroxy acid dehydrogenase YdfG